MDFTTIIAAPDAPLQASLRSIAEALAKVGFRADRSIVRVELDRIRGVFDESSPTVECVCDIDFASPSNDVSQWQGCALECWKDGLSLYFMIARIDGCLNIWIDIGRRALERLVASGRVEVLLSALAATCKAVDAVGGYGHLELSFHPLSLDESLHAFRDMPEHPGQKALLGIVRHSQQKSLDALENSRSPWWHVERLSVYGYWILLGDLESLLPRSS